MKLLLISISIILMFFLQVANSANLKIYGKQAKHIYNSLTGPGVQEEGAAGHTFRTGKSILCRYSNPDMEDSHGNSIPQGAPVRYACSINLDKNGLATPGKNPTN